jgi:hypothetical protein
LAAQKMVVLHQISSNRDESDKHANGDGKTHMDGSNEGKKGERKTSSLFAQIGVGKSSRNSATYLPSANGMDIVANGKNVVETLKTRPARQMDDGNPKSGSNLIDEANQIGNVGGIDRDAKLSKVGSKTTNSTNGDKKVEKMSVDRAVVHDVIESRVEPGGRQSRDSGKIDDIKKSSTITPVKWVERQLSCSPWCSPEQWEAMGQQLEGEGIRAGKGGLKNISKHNRVINREVFTFSAMVQEGRKLKLPLLMKMAVNNTLFTINQADRWSRSDKFQRLVLFGTKNSLIPNREYEVWQHHQVGVAVQQMLTAIVGGEPPAYWMRMGGPYDTKTRDGVHQWVVWVNPGVVTHNKLLTF